MTTMPTMLDTLLARAEHYEGLAKALRLAAAELNGHQREQKAARGIEGVLDQAIELRRKRKTGQRSWTDEQRAEASRAAKARLAEKVEKKRWPTKDERRAQRARTAALLDKFDTVTPRTAAEVGVGRRALANPLRWAYLKKKRGGYVRTKLPFTA